MTTETYGTIQEEEPSYLPGDDIEGGNDNDDDAHRRTQPARVSAIGAFSNIVKTFAGAGSFALPWSLQQSGVLAGLLSIVLLALLSDYTMMLLVRCRRFVQAQEEYSDSSDHWRTRAGDACKIPPPHRRGMRSDIYVDGATDETDVTTTTTSSITALETYAKPEEQQQLQADAVLLHEQESQQQRVRQLDDYLYNPYRTFTYIDLAFEAMGRPGSILMYLLLFSCNLGVCTVYWVFLGSLMGSMVPITDSATGDQALWMLFILPLFIILSCIRSYKYLAPFALLGTFALVGALSCVVVYGVLYHRDDMRWPWEYGKSSWFRPYTFPLSFGVTCFLFNTHAMVLPIEQSMRNRKWYPATLHSSFIFIVFVNMTFALLVFLFFGDDIKQDATANLLPGPFVYVIKAALVFELVATFPIVIQPVAEVVDEKLLNGIRRRSALAFYSASTAIRVFMVLIVFGVAEVAGDKFGIVMSFIGAFSPNLMGYIIPPLLYLILMRRRMGLVEFVFNCMLVVFGFLAMLTTISVSIMELAK